MMTSHTLVESDGTETAIRSNICWCPADDEAIQAANISPARHAAVRSLNVLAHINDAQAIRAAGAGNELLFRHHFRAASDYRAAIARIQSGGSSARTAKSSKLTSHRLPGKTMHAITGAERAAR